MKKDRASSWEHRLLNRGFPSPPRHLHAMRRLVNGVRSAFKGANVIADALETGAYYRRCRAPAPLGMWICGRRNVSHIIDCVHVFFVIILRRKIGRRGFVHRKWIDTFTEDFWTVRLNAAVIDERSIPAIEIPLPQRSAMDVAARFANRDVPLTALELVSLDCDR